MELSKGLIPSDVIGVDFYIKEAEPHKKGGATCIYHKLPFSVTIRVLRMKNKCINVDTLPNKWLWGPVCKSPATTFYPESQTDFRWWMAGLFLNFLAKEQCVFTWLMAKAHVAWQQHVKLLSSQIHSQRSPNFLDIWEWFITGICIFLGYSCIKDPDNKG